MLKFRDILICIAGTLLCNSLSAQWDESFFYLENEQYDQGTAFVSIDNMNHFANLEYYNPLAYSYTLAGYHIEPEINYYILDELSVSAGIYLMNLLGREKPWIIRPVYTLKYQPFDELELRFGNLKSGMEHRLVEQIYSYKQAYEQFNEEGIQARFINDNLFFDVWLDWRYLSLPNDNQPERIFGGYSIEYEHEINKTHHLSGFTQMTAWHNGGQNLSVERKLQTLLNFTGGVSYQYTLQNDVNLGAKSYFVHFENVVSQDILPFRRGYGTALELQSGWKFIEAKAGYWYANRFFAPLGNYLFSGISEKYTNYYLKKRSVLYAHGKIEKSFDTGITLGIRSGYYAGLDLNHSDFYIALLMRFNHKFFIKKQ